MAIACLRGLPAFSSLRMLAEMVFCEEPFFSGTYRRIFTGLPISSV